MADQNKIVYNINVNAEQGTATIRNLKGQIVATQIPVSDLRREFGNFAKQVNASDFNKFNKGIDKVRTKLDGSSKAAGASTSATLELGRVLSDMPYGIRGVANNIQQLASNLFFMSKATDESTGKTIGFKGAIGGLLKNLLGPAGILVAFQGIIALFDHFSSNTKKAKEELKGLTQEFTNLLNKLDDLQGKLPDTLSGLLVQLGLSNDEFTEFNKGLSTTLKILNNEFPEFKTAYEKLSDTQKKDPKVISDLITKYRELIQVRKDIVEKEQSLNTLREQGGKYAEANIKNNREAYKELILRKIALEDVFKKEEKISKVKKREKASVLFDTDKLTKESLKYVRELQKVDEKIALLSTKDKASRLIILRDFHMKRLLETNDVNSELIKSYKKYYAQLISEAEKSAITTEVDLSFGIGGLTPNEIKERQAQILEAKLQTMMEASQAITSFMNAEFQREIAIEQNKTNAINNELKERLNNENLSASERKRIQLEISKNDEAMRVKKEKLEKKAFKIQKAANIANALVSTYSGASAAYFNSLANPMNKLLPDGGLVRAKINAGIAAAVGLTNVAMIARQKFQSSSAGAPSAGSLGGGSGSDGGRDRSFNFNLAGASRENQLANTLQGRFDQPLQAYVVSRDITNSQQLDEDIRNNASFG